MTAQFMDQVHYRDKTYALAGHQGDALFDPRAFGIHPMSSCTACWRGYVCSYALRDNTLFLDAISLSMFGQPPVFMNVVPMPDNGQFKIFDAVYEGLSYPVPFTGGILLADDFIEELYVHMGYHPAWKFRQVYELIFRDGTLIEEADHSESMHKLRKLMGDPPNIPMFGRKKKAIKKWIKECFSLEYNF